MRNVNRLRGGVQMMAKAKRSYSPKLKFQVVLEALTGEKTPGQTEPVNKNETLCFRV